MMKRAVFGVAGTLVLFLSWWTSPATESDLPGIQPETVMDDMHAVPEADHTLSTIHVVERMQKQGGAPAAENWRTKKKTLPLSAQFFMESSDWAAKTGTKVLYRLISLWPINPNHTPDEESEKTGLEAVRQPPEQSAKNDGQAYFQAIDADSAVTQAGVECHIAHPRRPKKDTKLNDVTGGLVLEIPLSV